MDRVAWVGEARRRVYKTQREWVTALQNLGWEGINLSTIGTWESVGFLPTSLDYKSLNLVSRSLGLSANEVLRLQGVEIVEELGDITIPAELVDVVHELVAMDEHERKLLVPVLKALIEMVRSRSQS